MEPGIMVIIGLGNGLFHWYQVLIEPMMNYYHWDHYWQLHTKFNDYAKDFNNETLFEFFILN